MGQRTIEPEETFDPLHHRDAHQRDRTPLQPRVFPSQQVGGHTIRCPARDET